MRHTRDPAGYLREKMDIERVAAPHVRLDSDLAERPHLNVMLPSISHLMTGGPNTAINLAYQVAATGIPVRLIAVEDAAVPDPDWFWEHLRVLVGTDARLPHLTLGSCGDARAALPIGVNDMFLATYWTTAYAARHCVEQTNVKEFFYLIQDFEPAFFPWSSNYALALETYDMNFRAIINEATLAAYFCRSGTGRFADPGFIGTGSVFQPAVDRRYFHDEGRDVSRPRRLLVYARPGRNLRGIGYDSLCLATENAAFDGDWEFLSIGGTGLPVLDLGGNKCLRPAPWMGFADYAKLLRSSDILLCLMLSPHTSYPTLEMVACGGITVTNTFATKTREALLAISPNFVVGKPEVRAIAGCLIEAAERVHAGYDRDAAFALPRDWESALGDTTAKIADVFGQATGARLVG